MTAAGVQVDHDPAGLDGWRWRIARLEDENAALRQEQQRLEAEREQLRADNQRLWAERERLGQANERLRAEIEMLRRAAKRQAAPFSKGEPVADPKRAGRKPALPMAGGRIGVHLHVPIGSSRRSCRGAARVVVASWWWSGSRSSMSRTCQHPGR
jgi:hypothetical protein